MKLVIEDIQHNYKDIQFNYNALITDSITGIFGHSGSGKTTLLNIISGVETPVTGKIFFNDQVFFDKGAKVNVPENRRNIGVVFQENYLFPHLSIKKNLLYSKPYIKGKHDYISFERVIELLDIGDLLHKKPRQLSGGERQRVAIGRSLLSQPRLLLLDEPFSNLDRLRRHQIIAYLLKINYRFNIPLLIISHDLEDILKLTRSLLIIDKGTVQAAGDYLDIVRDKRISGLFKNRGFLNIFELYHHEFNKEDKLHAFGLNNEPGINLIKTSEDKFSGKNINNKRVRFGIYPDDIALTGKPVRDTSIQNQLHGTVTNICRKKDSCFITIDCGIDLIAEVTDAAVAKMNISVGKKLYCLIKAKAIEVIYIYNG